uniref:ATP synthase subunit a n=1 Tax=Mongoloniscus sinensis TaxID=1783568 RepID=A0A3G3LKM8_9CRUS|nr:ATP synthase F0 subunit 6 [Mongoloniscus sinensis]AYQ93282.1 ATP synthase F0 subunit 6 [Mongoloniscus sinensis]
MSMMTNLFSVFDPTTSVGMSFNWLAMTLGLLIFPTTKLVGSSRITNMYMMLFKSLNKEISPILLLENKVTYIIFLALFFFILWNNLMGLLPFIFTPTSHLVITLSLALPLWLGYFSYGWIYNFKNMLAHLTPQGTPAFLSPFMVVIESVSSLIRPGTLAIRLMANMIAGHLLLTLVSETINIFSFSSAVVIVVLQILLIILEVAVAMIQAYVLVVLSVLYVSEI